MQEAEESLKSLSFEEFKSEVLADYKIAYISRQASLIGRKEVLTGKAKFGIFGDGKEVAQLAMAKVFKKGDFRSGYYRDQTFMFALGISNVREFFAQLYANPSQEKEPCSAGRSMNGHFGTRFLDDDGNWLSQTNQFNSSADISPTGGQMPRLLGLAVASKLYRENSALHQYTDFSVNGNEVAFGTIGNASTSEGIFWEVLNAAGVMQVPMAMSVWDDGYGISVPAKYQTTKENISSILAGFKTDDNGKGFGMYTAKGWDYSELCQVYKEAIEVCRDAHMPVLIHVTEVTQPQGHSTSGSHERYKSADRLKWEEKHDCIAKMREWVVESSIATEEEIKALETEAYEFVKEEQKQAWKDFIDPIKAEISEVSELFNTLTSETGNQQFAQLAANLAANKEPMRKEIGNALSLALRLTININTISKLALQEYYKKFISDNFDRYSSKLYSNSRESVSNVIETKAEYSSEENLVDGRELMQACFDANLARDPRVFAFGEDLGKIGDVNQGFAGLQEKYGEIRVTDKGIRECSIVGEGIGTAMRGLRPIAEIQYLDYLLYAIQIMSDDIATLQYRTFGGQKAPVIIRTRGHRLEGIWHSGSPMGMIINAVRGMHVCVPRNMTQAAGMYNALLRCDEPALVIECLNGYRLKENLPTNIGDFTVPLGKPEIIRTGTDATLVTYGSCCRIAMDAANQLSDLGINIEIVDVQTLLPFDTASIIADSLSKTNRLVVLDEDVPGGASAYILQKILEEQNGYSMLDSKPLTITSKEHRPAYGTDGDYFSKPSADEVVMKVYQLMNEADPDNYPEM